MIMQNKRLIYDDSSFEKIEYLLKLKIYIFVNKILETLVNINSFNNIRQFHHSYMELY